MESTQSSIEYNADNFYAIQKFLGERPGGYRIDPYYLRKGMADKPYFWDAEKKKWISVRVGDRFYVNELGEAVRVPANGSI